MISHFSFLLAAVASTASAQYANNNTLGSCVDVDCPPGDEGACQVTNRTYGMIGLESFSTSITDNQGNLTWTIGSRVYDKPDPKDRTSRNIEKGFYLGTPPSLNLASDDLPYQGCAIFIYGNELIRPTMWNESQRCDDLVGSECMAALLTDATALLVNGQNETETAADACQRVQRGLNETFSSGCEKVAGQENWDRISAVDLTGEDAPAPPSQAANESSTCHPTLPKSNDLSFVFGYNDTGNATSISTVPMFWSVNLVLTMFWSPNSTVQGALAVPDSHLSCLWPVDLNNEALDRMDPGGAWRAVGSGGFASFVAIATAMCLLV